MKCDVCENKKVTFAQDCGECEQKHFFCEDCIHVNNCARYEDLEVLE